ncbi:MAG: HvfA family oxazolone/thioamide-modified RiPP metallophore [Panacagrimonas sp.]
MIKKPLSVVLGAAFALTGMAAQASVFQATDLGAGYMVAAAGDAKCGEGKCGEGKKAGEAKCGEHKGSNCDKTAGVGKDGNCACGANKGQKADGKCGEAKCGEKK